MLMPAVRDPRGTVSLWPFDGELPELVQTGRVVVLETYPGEMYGHFGIAGNNKRDQAFRREAATELVNWAKKAGVRLAEGLVAQVLVGFGNAPTAEDDFDAFVGLLGMLNVVLGRRSGGAPKSDGIRRVEGWMLGQAI